MQWYIEWLSDNRVSYLRSDVLAAMTFARQPLLHGPELYHRDAASGPIGDSDREKRAGYLTMLRSGTLQFAAKVIHEYLNKHSLVVFPTM